MKHRTIFVILAIGTLLSCAACSNSPGVHRADSGGGATERSCRLQPALWTELRRMPRRGWQGRSGHCSGESGFSRHRRRYRDSPHRLERSAGHSDARLCAECRWNAHRQADRRACAWNPILGEARCSRRSDAPLLMQRRLLAIRNVAPMHIERTALPVMESDGRGGNKASSIVDGSYLALVSDQQLRTIVIAGRPELGAPDWRGDVEGRPMSAQEISDVVAWLSSQRPKFPGQPYPTASMNPANGGSR